MPANIARVPHGVRTAGATAEDTIPVTRSGREDTKGKDMSGEPMELGAFSVSLAVADLGASREFYEKLGFERTGGDGEHYLILVNGLTVIGLFEQGMFEKNILTFNPGLGQDTKQLGDFSDIRDLRNRLADAGIEFVADLDPAGTGPASITFLDPDGNPVLIDQFFSKPGSSEGS